MKAKIQKLTSGKVREIFELGEDRLLMVASDRISAYDRVFPSPIPGKGVLLTQIAKFWFRQIHFLKHHWREEEEKPELWKKLQEEIPDEWKKDLSQRAMIVEKGEVIPYECIVRGYAFGSYLKAHPEVAPMTPFSPPIFTPTTKAKEGHDEKMDFQEMERDLGESLAQEIRQASVELFEFGRKKAAEKGLVLVDTKFEFALDAKGQLMVVDEIFTPDSSRYFLEEDLRQGKFDSPLDKQYFRQYLDRIGFHDQSPDWEIPQEEIEEILRRYRLIYHHLTG